MYEGIYEHTDPFEGFVTANAVYVHGDGTTVVVETMPPGTVEEAFPASEYDDTCPNAQWCEDGLLVWYEGEQECYKPCPACAAGERVDADMEEAQIRAYESAMEDREPPAGWEP